MDINIKKTVNEKIEEYEDEEDDKKKKLRISIPLILLVLLLLLPTSIGIYAIKGKNSPLLQGQTSGVGEEISIEDYTDDPIPSNEDDDEVKNSPNKKDAEQQEEEKEKNDEKEQETLKENVNKEETKKDVPKEPEPEKKEEEVKQNEEVKQETSEGNNQQAGQTLTHTVKSGETLYRIAMHYYKSQDGIEKIKAANGLTSNEINVGQTLNIPQP